MKLQLVFAQLSQFCLAGGCGGQNVHCSCEHRQPGQAQVAPIAIASGRTTSCPMLGFQNGAPPPNQLQVLWCNEKSTTEVKLVSLDLLTLSCVTLAVT